MIPRKVSVVLGPTVLWLATGKPSLAQRDVAWAKACPHSGDSLGPPEQENRPGNARSWKSLTLQGPRQAVSHGRENLGGGVEPKR